MPMRRMRLMSNISPPVIGSALPTNLSRKVPAVIEKHDLETEDEGFGDEIDDPPGFWQEPIHHQLEADVAPAVRSHDRPVEGKPHKQVRGELVVPRQGCVENVEEEKTEQKYCRHHDEEENRPPF